MFSPLLRDTTNNDVMMGSGSQDEAEFSKQTEQGRKQPGGDVTPKKQEAERAAAAAAAVAAAAAAAAAAAEEEEA